MITPKSAREALSQFTIGIEIGRAICHQSLYSRDEPLLRGRPIPSSGLSPAIFACLEALRVTRSPDAALTSSWSWCIAPILSGVFGDKTELARRCSTLESGEAAIEKYRVQLRNYDACRLPLNGCGVITSIWLAIKRKPAMLVGVLSYGALKKLARYRWSAGSAIRLDECIDQALILLRFIAHPVARTLRSIAWEVVKHDDWNLYQGKLLMGAIQRAVQEPLKLFLDLQRGIATWIASDLSADEGANA